LVQKPKSWGSYLDIHAADVSENHISTPTWYWCLKFLRAKQ